MGQEIRLDVLGHQTVGEDKVKKSLEQGPFSLAGVNAFRKAFRDVLKALVIYPDNEWLLCPPKPVFPLLKG